MPPYAILSHTWGPNEVSFQDMLNSKSLEGDGYEKIVKCCELATSDGFEYAWVDTCCIDKTSSSELSEAINSMYRWYGNAHVCYVILSDVTTNEDPHDQRSTFRRSRWFTRGWTLQELIVPRTVIFYSKDWIEIGTKLSLRTLVADITQIDEEILSFTQALKYFSIAQKMSWASRRQTTRTEDLAYCLMGIFEINMPLLYGEGMKAFVRLQEQILSVSDDDSILAWEGERRGGSCLASSPAAFSNAKDIIFDPCNSTPINLTKYGLRMEMVTHGNIFPSPSFAELRCGKKNDTGILGIQVFDTQTTSSLIRPAYGLQLLAKEELYKKIRPSTRLIELFVDRSPDTYTPVSALVVFVETLGLVENGVSVLEKSNYASRPGTSAMYVDPILVSKASGWVSITKTFDTLQFSSMQGTLGFDVQLNARRESTSARPSVAAILDLPRSEYFSPPGSNRELYRDLASGLGIKVTIRPQNVTANKTVDYNGTILNVSEAFMVRIAWDMPGDTNEYETMSLREMIRKQKQVKGGFDVERLEIRR
jgi:hypothetical protein